MFDWGHGALLRALKESNKELINEREDARKAVIDYQMKELKERDFYDLLAIKRKGEKPDITDPIEEIAWRKAIDKMLEANKDYPLVKTFVKHTAEWLFGKGAGADPNNQTVQDLIRLGPEDYRKRMGL